MYIKPEIAFHLEGSSPVYKCKCGYHFTRTELLNNKVMKGTRNYCPKCKTKFNF